MKRILVPLSLAQQLGLRLPAPTSQVQVRSHTRRGKPVKAHTRTIEVAPQLDLLGWRPQERPPVEEGPTEEAVPSHSLVENLMDACRAAGWNGRTRKVKDVRQPLPRKQAETLEWNLGERGEAYRSAGDRGLNADHRQNTYRQQRQAAASFAQAEAVATLGQAFLNVVKAVEAGEHQLTYWDKYMSQEPYRELVTRAAQYERKVAEGETNPNYSREHDGAFIRLPAWSGTRADQSREIRAAAEEIRRDLAAAPTYEAVSMLWERLWGEWSKPWVSTSLEPAERAEALRLKVGEHLQREIEAANGADEARDADPNRELVEAVLANPWPGARIEHGVYVFGTDEALATAIALEKAGHATSRWGTKASTQIKRLQDVGWRRPEDRAVVAKRWEAWRDRFIREVKRDTTVERPASVFELGSPERMAAAEEAERKRFIPHDLQGIAGFFETPPTVVERMLLLADLNPGDSVLEPSAGRGGIADNVPADCKLTVAEYNFTLMDSLREKGYTPIHDMFKVPGQYDRVVMNPPFEGGMDVEHVTWCFNEKLKDGGILVAITGPGWKYRKGKKWEAFRDLVAEYGDRDSELPAGTFKNSNTGVSSRLIRLRKPTA